MSVRTYCVIPHSARADTEFFQGVFEDGLRVFHQGRLHSLLFSHVLSPAHDVVKHVNGPLLAALRDGANATLILATPNSELPTATPTTNSTSSSPAAGAAPVHSVKSTDMAEVTPTVMELYAHLFPLLFRSLDACATARVSAVTLSATERVLLDGFNRDCRLRSLDEARHLTLHRSTSATEWGTLMRLLEGRHAAAQESATALEGQTACVVTVDMADYGRLVVVDTASSQELLQQLTLILGMEASDGAGRTYPSHTPLRDLLRHNTPPEAVVQVVCVPAPRDAARQTMRVLHFGSAVETWRSRRSRSTSSGGTRRHTSNDTSELRTDLSAAGVGGSARSKLFARPTTATAASPSVSFAVDSAGQESGVNAMYGPYGEDAHRHAAHPRDAALPLGSSGDVGEANRGDGESLGAGFDDSNSGSSTASQPRRYVPPAESRSGAIQSGATPAHLPPSSLDRAVAVQYMEREEQLHRRVRSLETQLADVRKSQIILRKERDDAVAEKERVQLSLRSKESMWADLQRAHNKAKQENADYAQLVEKLLKQVRVMERDTSRQKQQDMAVVKQLRQTREEKAELEAQVARLRKEMMLFRREATYRAREATLSRIVPSDISVPAPQSRSAVRRSSPSPRASGALGGMSVGEASSLLRAPQRRNGGGRLSPRARRLYDASSSAPDGSVDGRAAAVDANDSRSGSAAATPPAQAQEAATAPSRRVTDITVEELRWRNRHLEEEVNRLQERLLRALASADEAAAASSSAAAAMNRTSDAKGAAGSCSKCESLRERAEYYSAELAHVRAEKDRLLDLVQSTHASNAASTKKVRFSSEADDSTSQASTAADGERAEQSRGSSRAGERHLSHFPEISTGATRTVVAALLSGCASLQSQLASAQAVLDRRLRHTAAHTDPLSHVSSRVLVEHREAVAALSESLQRIADKPATVASSYAPPLSTAVNASSASDANASVQQPRRVSLPPVPRCASAGNVEVLTGHLAFEVERCRHLRAFLPTFAQLAVATEHLLMRLEATEAGSMSE